MKLETKLSELVASGAITSFLLQELDETGEVGYSPKGRNTERLILDFPNGERLVLGTFCSGVMENTHFCIESEVALQNS